MSVHLEYAASGPTEVGRSESYEDIEVMFDLDGDDGPVVWFMGRVGEEWGEIANVELRPEFGEGELGVASWEGGPQHYTGYKNIRTVFVSVDQ